MRNTLKQQIAWAQGRAAQARRLAATSGSLTTKLRQFRHAATAEAVAASLQDLADQRNATRSRSRATSADAQGTHQ